MELDKAFLIIVTSVAVSVLTEFVSWLLVYRTSGYKRVKEQLDRDSKKWEQYKQLGASKKDNDKKEKKLEETVKTSAKEFQAVKMKANMVTGLVNLLVLNRLLAAFEGQPVARLPFQPFGFIANNITHRGLPGDDIRECSALFIYILCTTFCKMNFAQGCPWSPSRAAERAMKPQPAAYDPENKAK